MEQKTKASSKHTAIIEINGQRYNAVTGERVAAVSPSAAPSHVVSDITPSKTFTSSINRSKTTSSHVHKTSQPSKTLMRHVVKKPAAPTVNHSQTPVVAPPAMRDVAPQIRSASSPLELRAKRAHTVERSTHISRFGSTVRSAPESPVVNPAPVSKHVAQLDVVPAPAHPHTSHIQHPHKTTESHATKRSPKEEAISKGLAAASSHTPTHHKKTALRHRVAKHIGLGRRATNIAATSVAVLLLGSFVAYQNIPNLAVRYASIKSGVKASLPGYKPAGFAVNDAIQYSPGEVAVHYETNVDDRQYTVIQKSSSWDNNALKDNYVATTGTQVQEYTDNGRTIYLYGDSNATWVESGVWYEIRGNSGLNTPQLIKIATSL